MFCRNCGKEIDDRAAVCIYCGIPTGEAVPEKKTNGYAIAGFVIGFISLYFGVYLCIPPIIGLIFSIIGLVNKKKYTSCNGFAIAGLVLSIISLIIWGIGYFLILIAIIMEVGANL